MKLTDQIQPFLHLVFPLQIGGKSPAHVWVSLHDKYTTQKMGFSQLQFKHGDLSQLDR